MEVHFPTITTPLLSLTNSLPSPGSIIWKGKRVIYGIKNILICTGALAAGFSIYKFIISPSSVEISAPVLSGISIVLCVITCTGGLCLWKMIPYKQYEDVITNQNNNIVTLQKEKKELNEGINKFQSENSSLKTTVDKVIEDNAKLRAELINSSNRLTSSLHSLNSQATLGEENSKAYQLTTHEFAVNVDKLDKLLGRLQERDNQSGDANDFLESRKHYLKDSHE